MTKELMTCWTGTLRWSYNAIASRWNLPLTSINSTTSSKKLCGVSLNIEGKALCINVFGPRILLDKLAIALRISVPNILCLSWIISHPIRHPGTRNLFVRPLHVKTGTFLDMEDIAMDSCPEKTKCSYISSAMIGTRFLSATSTISCRWSLL